ncbi:MAG: GTPase HflX [Vampirovibrionales bacterium]
MVSFLLGAKDHLDSASRKQLEQFEHWKLSPKTWWEDELVSAVAHITQMHRTPLTLLWDGKGQLLHVVVAPLALLHRVPGLYSVVSRHKPGTLWAWSFHVGEGQPQEGDTSGILHLKLGGCLFLETTGHKAGEVSRKALKQHKKHDKLSATTQPWEERVSTCIAGWRWLFPVFQVPTSEHETKQPLLRLQECGRYTHPDDLMQALKTLEAPLLDTWADALDYAQSSVYAPFQTWCQARRPGAIVISVHPSQASVKQEAQTTMEELVQLLDTLGYDVRTTVVQHRPKPDVRTYLGEGRAETLALEVVQYGIERIVVDETLSPTQVRHLEALVRVPVWDRSEVILNVFEARAKTPEGKLQVALARLKYDMPRLAGRNQSLSRQTATGAGAGAATRGSGETQLELDRRHIRERIQQLETEIEQLAQRRERQRTRRHEGRRNPAYVVALVGYTNAGKSTLMRRLSGDKTVYVEDKLFATLDTLSRPFFLPNEEALRYTSYDGTPVYLHPDLPPVSAETWDALRPNVLVDTVGFIRKLPTQLVYAFKSTLEEAHSSDLLLHVWDVASPHAYEQFLSVQETLAELGADTLPTLVLCNKQDLLAPELKTQREAFLLAQGVSKAQTLWLSATALEGETLEAFYHTLTFQKYRSA